MTVTTHQAHPLGLRRIWETWWPLAVSWVFMGIELPIVSVIMARLSNPEVNLAAYAGVVFPISLLIEAPIIMLLAASTVLSKNWASYVLLRRFMAQTASVLTAVHILVAFTPLYDIIVTHILGAPEEIREPARIGLMFMTPWTLAIAIRRFQQGVLIRWNRSRSIGMGTAVRLATNVTILTTGYLIGTISGIMVATMAVSAGVIAEALFIRYCVQPLLREMQNQAPRQQESLLTMPQLLTFYIPLAITPFFTLLALPISSAALSRMPLALESLAVWPALAGLTFTLRSFGLAYNEVVVALIDRPGAVPTLRRFAGILATTTSGLLLIIVATPLAPFWFGHIAGLSSSLTLLGATALWFAIFTPALSVIESWYQGVILHSHQTRGIIEAVAAYLLTSSAIFAVGIHYGQVTGLYVGVTAAVSGLLMQTLWLRVRSRCTLRALLAYPPTTT